MASIKKFQIIAQLAEKYGIHIKSTQQLNKILVEMGILVKDANFWKATKKGLPFTASGNAQVLNEDLWKVQIVDAIASFLKNK